ncbi:type 1 glutamine amidotransferase [Marinihelvus fidelis]|uniref:Type 1 glutamine amidotransferase n=1 Tax=Marinihelvus fidelis TaxID=2613842 RepID=A0A5N0T8H2_9GAMM|nr:type 1 glutamine amidotransferase [Marinihelvus fidelis]KAA9130447.1 type 1 glutamine amidotransferase [Marinihelvus fidelis]
MAKVLVFQHVASEPLGTLDPMLRRRGHRIRYINFHRNPDAQPNIDRYQALIVLGGPMMPDQQDRYPHLRTEMHCIERALARNMPVLGICLGSQLLAHTLGAPTKPAREWEIGWYDVEPTAAAKDDPVLCRLGRSRPIFQWHGYTFDLPDGATRLARSQRCENQAFRVGEQAYGFQFHLELDGRLINRWLKLPTMLDELHTSGVPHDAQSIWRQTHELIDGSIALSDEVFGAFLDKLGTPLSRQVMPSR